MKKVPRQTFKTASRDSKKQRWEHARKVWCFFGVLLSPPHEDLGTAIKNERNAAASRRGCRRRRLPTSALFVKGRRTSKGGKRKQGQRDMTKRRRTHGAGRGCYHTTAKAVTQQSPGCRMLGLAQPQGRQGTFPRASSGTRREAGEGSRRGGRLGAP